MSQPPKITPYNVNEGKVTSLKIEDGFGKEIIETEPFCIEDVEFIAPLAISYANRKRQLEVFRRTCEEGEKLLKEAEDKLNQAIRGGERQILTVNRTEAIKQPEKQPQQHDEGCGCSECAEKHRQEFDAQIVKVPAQDAGQETNVVEQEKVEAPAESPPEKEEEIRIPVKIPEIPEDISPEQLADDIYEKVMASLQTDFKGQTIKTELILKKVIEEYKVPEDKAQEVVAILHERAKKEKKVSESEGEGLFKFISKKLRRTNKKKE